MIREGRLEAAQIGLAASRADGCRLAALSSVAAAPLRLPPPPCQTRPSPRSSLRPTYLRGLLVSPPDRKEDEVRRMLEQGGISASHRSWPRGRPSGGGGCYAAAE